MTVTQPLEIELKLALPPQQAAGFLRRMARRRGGAVRQTLVTRYFDTPDFSLSAQGVALRVRRVGRRWLQTLKTEGVRQGGLSRRAEYEMPVSRGEPDWSRFPAEALALVPESLRAQVAPVFETRFSRTAWLVRGAAGAQIEVALDVGEVSAGQRSQPICEVELELKAGRPDALYALALEWAGAFDFLPFDTSKAERGVRLARGTDAAPMKSVPLALDRSMSVEEGFAAVCQACLAQFQANLPGVLYPSGAGGEGADVMRKPSPLPNPLIEPLSDRLSPQAGKSPLIPQAGEGANVMPKPIDDIEYVHQARVALRRLRAALRLYRRTCALPDELMEGLRAITTALGPARDWDVLCAETLPAIAPHYADPDAWRRGVEPLEARRARVRAAMRAELIRARPGAWLLAVQRWLLGHGWRAVPEARRFVQLSPQLKWARRALRKGHRPIVRGARDFAQLQPLQRHALRIAVKRQRYAAEFFQGLFGGQRQLRYLAVLCGAQDSLGRSNDAHVAWELMMSGRAEAGPMGEFVLGWLAAMQAGAADGESAGRMRAFLESKPYW